MVVAAVARHVHGPAGRETTGGALVGDAGLYDSLGRWLLGSFFDGIAADVAASTPLGARVLEVGCGPGHLSIRLAREHGMDVTGIDLDPAMIERALANSSASNGDGRLPSFAVGDVASLAFQDGAFDLVVSTLSMHHWADPAAGLNEIARVLRRGGQTLVWDFRRGSVPLHGQLADPAERAHGTALNVVNEMPWRWPWLLTLTQRVQLVRAADVAALGSTTSA